MRLVPKEYAQLSHPQKMMLTRFREGAQCIWTDRERRTAAVLWREELITEAKTCTSCASKCPGPIRYKLTTKARRLFKEYDELQAFGDRIVRAMQKGT